MDDIQGSVLQGTITGTVNGGADIVPGRVGGALHLNGIDQNVNFGPYTSACYHTFEECPDGVTWAMWLKLEGGTFSVILDSGGSFSGATGYTLFKYETGSLKIQVKTTTHLHILLLRHWEPGYWVHLVFSLHPITGASIYLNGCGVTDRAFVYTVKTSSFNAVYRPFVLGSYTINLYYTAMDIDNLLIWYDILTSEEVLKLYLQGGVVWFWWNRCTWMRFPSVRPTILSLAVICPLRWIHILGFCRTRAKIEFKLLNHPCPHRQALMLCQNFVIACKVW